MKKKVTLQSLASTLEDLAGMTQRGFEEIKDTMKGMATKAELMETREVLSQKIEDLDLHFSASNSHVREKVDRHDTRIENLEERVDKLETKKSR